jgi:chemotaxis protein CheX
MTTLVALAENDLFTIVQQVWASFLGGEEVADAELLIGSVGRASEVNLTGCVSISGEWTGSVLLTCSQEAAGVAAARMFMADLDQLSDEEIIDAMGELTNMVGGSIKAILPGPSQLSIPTVTSGRNFDTRVPSAQLAASVEISWCGTPLNVAVWRS